MKKSQRLLSLLLAAVLLLGLLPASALGANTTPRVHVTVENTTYTEANAASDWIAPAWSGQLLNVWVPLEGTMTMMSCIDWALESAGYIVTVDMESYDKETGRTQIALIAEMEGAVYG